MNRKIAVIILAGMLSFLCACQPVHSGSEPVSNDSKITSEAKESEPKQQDTSSEQESITEKSSLTDLSSVIESSVETSEETSGVLSESSSESSIEIKTESFQVGESEYVEYPNGVVIFKDRGHYRAVSMFGGGTANAYVSALNAYHEVLGDTVKIYSVTAPLSSEFYLPSNYTGSVVDQKNELDNIAKRLNDGIIYVDVDTALSHHVTEDIYLRTDHHWAPLGAYYAAEAFAKAAGVTFKELSFYTPKDIEGFSGSMYAFTGNENINNDPELFRYYIPDNYENCQTEYYSSSMAYSGGGNYFNEVGNPQSNAYLTFMGGDKQIVKVSTDTDNGRKLMIIKDSFGNAVPGYLFGSFEEIYVVDMRYCDVNVINLIQLNGITDVAFVMDVFSMVGNNANYLDVIRTQ